MEDLREKLFQYNKDLYAHAILTAIQGTLGKDIDKSVGVEAAEEFLPRLEQLIASYTREAEIKILRKVYEDTSEEIDRGVPEVLAYRTVLLQTEQNLKDKAPRGGSDESNRNN